MGMVYILVTFDLVIIDQAYIAHLTVLEPKDHPPVSVDGDRPEAPEIAAQLMEPIAGQSHLFRCNDLVQTLQDAFDLGDHVLTDAGTVTSLIDPLQSLVCKASDHT